MSIASELAALQTARRAPTAAAAAALLSGEMIHSVITANSAGNNILIPAGQRIAVMEIFLWNAAGAQTLILQDGVTPLNRLTGMPAGSGLMFGFAGNGEPHFRIAAGNAFLLNLSVGTLVDGFVKYRLG